MQRFFAAIIPQDIDSKAVCYGPRSVEIDQIISELNSNPEEYLFEKDDMGTDLNREDLRSMFGYSSSLTASLTAPAAGSPITIVNRGKDIKLTFNRGKSFIVISGEDVLRCKAQASVFYDPHKISIEQVKKILMIKAGQPVRISLEESEQLESLASYMLVAGESKKYKAGDGSFLAQPLPTFTFSNCFPNLSRSSKDLKEFCCDINGDIYIADPEGLKEKFKEVIRFTLAAAAYNNEAVDLLTPNAFLYALTDKEQDKAKLLFAKAVTEVACEPAPKGLKCLFVHATPGMHDSLKALSSHLTFPVIVTNCEASAPNRAAAKLENPFVVRESIMAEGLGKFGNGALGPKAYSAAEERHTRTTLGTDILATSPAFNLELLDKPLIVLPSTASNPLAELDEKALFLAAIKKLTRACSAEFVPDHDPDKKDNLVLKLKFAHPAIFRNYFMVLLTVAQATLGKLAMAENSAVYLGLTRTQKLCSYFKITTGSSTALGIWMARPEPSSHSPKPGQLGST